MNVIKIAKTVSAVSMAVVSVVSAHAAINCYRHPENIPVVIVKGIMTYIDSLESKTEE